MYVTAKARAGSDHVPLILNFGIQEARKPSLFRFEKWWFEQPDFKQLVTNVWNTSCASKSAIDVWQFKIRLLRKKVKGWAININVDIKRQKVELIKEFNILDRKYEIGLLLPEGKQRIDDIVRDLEKIGT